jgi:hypothetical protein
MVVLLGVGLALFGYVFVLLALVAGGPVLAAVVGVLCLLGGGVLLARLLRSLRR